MQRHYRKLVSVAYVLYVIIAKYVRFKRHFYDIKKRLIFYSKLNFGDTNSCIVQSEMSLHTGQEKKLLRGQIIIAKVTLERAPGNDHRLSNPVGLMHIFKENHCEIAMPNDTIPALHIYIRYNGLTFCEDVGL